jgi:hypothetical protein
MGPLFLAWRMTLNFMSRKGRGGVQGMGQDGGEGKRRGATWTAFRGPLLVAVLIVMFVVFATQKTLWEGTVGLLPAFATGLPAVISALKLSREYKEKKPGAGG